MKDYDGALSDYNQAMNLGLSETGLYFNRGVILQIKKNYKAAIRDYSQAIQIDPSNPKLFYNRAIAKCHSTNGRSIKRSGNCSSFGI